MMKQLLPLLFTLLSLSTYAESTLLPIMDCEDIDTTICSGEIFEFESQIFDETGTYTLTSVNCDGMFNLNLTVVEKPETIVTSVEICSGEVYYWGGGWCGNGSEVTVFPPYIIYNNGCTANDSLDLTIVPKPKDIINQYFICEGESYVWSVNGEVYTISGTYSVYGGDNCSADYYLQLYVLQPNEIQTTTEIINSGETYTWSVTGEEYTEAGTYEYFKEECNATLRLILLVEDQSTSVSGTFLYDIDGDGCSISTIPISNIPISNSLYTDRDSMVVSVSLDENLILTPTDTTVYFDNSGESLNIDYCISSDVIYDDLSIVLLPLEPARPGIPTDYRIKYSNNGYTTLSGEVTLQVNDTQLMSADPEVTSSTGMTSTWTFTSLLPFEERIIDLELKPDQTLMNGDPLNYSASITPVDNDATPEDNVYQLDHSIVTSFDPNDITLIEGDTLPVRAVGGWVHYMIRFENKGTANANFVILRDTLNPDYFDVSTFTPVDYSHDCNISIDTNNEIYIHYEEIELPFTVEDGNMGYFIYKVKLRTDLVEGDTFTNQANIFFDFNEPILTNLSVGLIMDPVILNTLDRDDTDIDIYPNPTQGKLHLTLGLGSATQTEITLLNEYGKTLKTLSTSENQVTLNYTHYPAGIYFVQIRQGDKVVIEKVVIL